jgi:tRNA U54 and U55 pseudouridine synthase Pus10
MKLMERDYLILREIERWKYCLGRHIRILAGFTGQRACDRRLRLLIQAKLIERKYVLYGVPGFYNLTHRAKMLVGANKRQDKIRLDHVLHDIAVLDTAIYFSHKYGIPFNSIVTEKQLHSKDGFSVRNHQPDFTFIRNGKTYCVEVELSLKSNDRLEKNVKENFQAYDTQIWVVGVTVPKVVKILGKSKELYDNIEILSMEGINKYVRELN